MTAHRGLLLASIARSASLRGVTDGPVRPSPVIPLAVRLCRERVRGVSAEAVDTLWTAWRDRVVAGVGGARSTSSQQQPAAAESGDRRTGPPCAVAAALLPTLNPAALRSLAWPLPPPKPPAAAPADPKGSTGGREEEGEATGGDTAAAAAAARERERARWVEDPAPAAERAALARLWRAAVEAADREAAPRAIAALLALRTACGPLDAVFRDNASDGGDRRAAKLKLAAVACVARWCGVIAAPRRLAEAEAEEREAMLRLRREREEAAGALSRLEEALGEEEAAVERVEKGNAAMRNGARAVEEQEALRRLLLEEAPEKGEGEGGGSSSWWDVMRAAGARLGLSAAG